MNSTNVVYAMKIKIYKFQSVNILLVWNVGTLGCQNIWNVLLVDKD
jgi:hypothetical protein